MQTQAHEEDGVWMSFQDALHNAEAMLSGRIARIEDQLAQRHAKEDQYTSEQVALPGGTAIIGAGMYGFTMAPAIPKWQRQREEEMAAIRDRESEHIIKVGEAVKKLSETEEQAAVNSRVRREAQNEFYGAKRDEISNALIAANEFTRALSEVGIAQEQASQSDRYNEMLTKEWRDKIGAANSFAESTNLARDALIELGYAGQDETIDDIGRSILEGVAASSRFAVAMASAREQALAAQPTIAGVADQMNNFSMASFRAAAAAQAVNIALGASIQMAQAVQHGDPFFESIDIMNNCNCEYANIY